MARPQALTFQPPPVHTSLPRLLSRGNKHVLTSGPPPTLFLLAKAPFPILLGMLPPHRHLRWDHTDFSLTISGQFSPREHPRSTQISKRPGARRLVRWPLLQEASTLLALTFPETADHFFL